MNQQLRARTARPEGEGHRLSVVLEPFAMIGVTQSKTGKMENYVATILFQSSSYAWHGIKGKRYSEEVCALTSSEHYSICLCLCFPPRIKIVILEIAKAVNKSANYF